MAEETKLAEIVNQLAMQTIMVEPEDLMTLGAILEKLESLEKMDGKGSPQPIGKLVGGLKKLVEKIILQEVSDFEAGSNLLRAGVGCLQRKITNASTPAPDPEEAAFWAKIGPFLGLQTESSGERPAGVEEPKKEGSEEKEDSCEPAQDLEIFKDFVSEAMEHLATIELNIINLEQNPEDKECINTIFRPFHTIKGVAGFLNLQEIQKFSHAMENLLDEARNLKLPITQPIIDFILEAVDLLKNTILDLKSQLDAGQAKHGPLDLDRYLEKINALRRGEGVGGSIGAPPRAPDAPKDAPQGQDPPPLGKILAAQGVLSETDVRDALKEQATHAPDLKIGEILVKDHKAKPKQVIEALREQKKGIAQFTDSTVKVDMQKLDNLVDMVGELVIAQSLVQQNPAITSIREPKLSRDLSQLKRITTDLQKISMSLRMVPIRHTFQKMIRLVRDLGKKSGKLVELVMSGEDTEIDRNMVDTLYDPLVHMIRNSVDHGIEQPDKRRAHGKPEMGKIFLRAFQNGGYIVIEIEDDGQGLNRKKILQKAKEKGMISPDASLNDYQVDNLIFEPGFSTADKVTDISGRGVGMDVVKRTLEQLKGKMEVVATEGKGTRFILRVPLTLAIMDGIVVKVGPERYIIPSVFIKETLRPRSSDLTTIKKKGELIKVRGTLLPLIRLYHLLGVAPQKENPWEALVVVVENGGYQKGLLVDDLIGKQEVVIKNLGEKFQALKGVAGATILGDGRVGLILDIQGVFEVAQMN